MAQPGWYPDPGGAPGRYRYWDGTAWSPTTSATPTGQPPAAGPKRSRTPWVVAAVLALVVAVIVAAVALWPQPAVDPGDPLPSTSLTGGDDSSPTPAPSATPSPSTSPIPAPTAPSQPCPTGDPTARQPHPNDGRIHGGGLSFPRQPGFDGDEMARGLTWAYDVDGQDKAVEVDWYAMFAVGALFTLDGFETPEQAADAVLQCTASSDFYEGFTERNDLTAEPVSVSGHPGFRIRSEIRVQNEQTTVPGDIVEVVVVDLDSPESLAMFLGAVPIGDQALLSQLDRVRSQLRAD